MARKPENYINKIFLDDWEDVIESLPKGIVHTGITSPPYWGQRAYIWGGDGSCAEKKISHKWVKLNDKILTCENCHCFAPILGMEKTPEEHIENLVRGFGKFKRILRDDGTLWVNYSDKYAGGGNNRGNKSPISQKQASNKGATGQCAEHNRSAVEGVEDGNLLCLPWRVAMALQSDSWYLRSVIIWCKAWSFHDCGYETKIIKSEGLFGQELEDIIEEGQNYAGSTMPESMNGWRWERHKLKVKSIKPEQYSSKVYNKANPETKTYGWSPNHPEKGDEPTTAQWKLCPGCAKCNPHDGWVLRKGSWRPTSAYEYLFMFSKTKSYYADAEAVKEEGQDWGPRDRTNWKAKRIPGQSPHTGCENGDYSNTGRNLRNVWCIGTKGYKGAHYATFPEALIEPVIKASTSQKGVCPKCGAPWARMIETDYIKIGSGTCGGRNRFAEGDKSGFTGKPTMKTNNTTLGWMPACECEIEETVPALVYDPFMGSGTVAAVADKLGRYYCGSELNEDYIREQCEPRLERLWRA